MMKKTCLLLCTLLVALCKPCPAQDTLRLTLDDCIQLARQQSPTAKQAIHTFRSAYWNYRYYRANYLPMLSLTSNPYLNRAINKITMSDGTVQFVEQNLLSTDLTLSLTQNVPWTGGTLFVETAAQRLDLLSDDTHSYQTSPINIGYSQSLFGYNTLKWDRKLEPIRYREAKRSLIEALELVAAGATEQFFSLAQAQSSLEIANSNFAHADTLYNYAKGRYDIGTISENEMLQLELNRLTEETNRMNAQIEVENAEQELRSYLGILQEVKLIADIASPIPDVQIDLASALMLAAQNSPDVLNRQLRKLESESAVAKARSNAGLKADLYLRFGLTQTGKEIQAAYKHPLQQQYVTLSVTLPILDWGRGKGKVRVAKSQRDLVYSQVEQDQTDFEQNVRKLVNQFNLQKQRVHIARRTDHTAERRATVARKLYLLGKSSILDLNASTTEKESARRSYLTSLHDYWSIYFTLRSFTLYDFLRNAPLEDFAEQTLQ